jgi:4-amino-4-deoxy-L-arabinose transferase-like glycosyltransferase
MAATTSRPGLRLDDRALAIAVPVLGLLVRLAYAISRRHDEVGGDAYYFHNQANLIADGHGFINPLVYAYADIERAAADHPPLYSAYLSLWSLVGVRTPLGHMVASALMGTATVVLVGAAGRRLGGARVGLLAATAAAVHPNLWLWDGALLSETASAFTVALYLYLAVRLIERPTAGRLAAVGASIGLASLARSEMALLTVGLVLLIPLLPRAAGRARARAGAMGIFDRATATRVGAAAVAMACLVAVIVPWSAYNQGRFAHPVPLSTGAGLVLVSSNCDLTYEGPLIGYWSFVCSVEGGLQAGTDSFDDASETDRKLREVATDFAGEHRDRLPAVAAARLGRVLALYRPFQQVGLLNQNEGVPRWISEVNVGTWYLFAGLAIVGARRVRRQKVPLAALLAPLGTVLVVAVLVYGIWRFRAPADVAVCLLAGVGADTLVRRLLEGNLTAPAATSGLLGRHGALAETPAATVAETAAVPSTDRRVTRRRPPE